MTDAQIKQITEAADDLVPDVIDIVTEIENSAPTTQDHYGRYMAVLSTIDDKLSRLVTALAMSKAGANKAGISWALKLIED